MIEKREALIGDFTFAIGPMNQLSNQLWRYIEPWERDPSLAPTDGYYAAAAARRALIRAIDKLELLELELSTDGDSQAPEAAPRGGADAKS